MLMDDRVYFHLYQEKTQVLNSTNDQCLTKYLVHITEVLTLLDDTHISIYIHVEACLTLVPSIAGRLAVATARRRGVRTWRTLFKPRSMLPRTLRAESGGSFGVSVPSVLK